MRRYPVWGTGENNPEMMKIVRLAQALKAGYIRKLFRTVSGSKMSEG